MKLKLIAGLFLLATCTAQAHGSGYWGAEVQKHLNAAAIAYGNDMTTYKREIKIAEKLPVDVNSSSHLAYINAEKNIQQLWDTLPKNTRIQLRHTQRKWILYKDSLGSEDAKTEAINHRIDELSEYAKPKP